MIAISLLIIAVGLFLNYYRVMQEAEKEKDRIKISGMQLDYIYNLYFDNNWSIFPSEIRSTRAFEVNLGIIDVTFVESEAEAGDFSCDMIYAWPTERSQIEIDAWNYWISDLDIDLSEFDLTYPLTTSDLVHNWENVRLLFLSEPSRRGEPIERVRYYAPYRAIDISRGRFNQEFDLLNMFLEGRDFSEHGFELPFERDVVFAYDARFAFNELLTDLYQSELQGEIDISFILYHANMRAGIFAREAAEICPRED